MPEVPTPYSLRRDSLPYLGGRIAWALVMAAQDRRAHRHVPAQLGESGTKLPKVDVATLPSDRIIRANALQLRVVKAIHRN
jgi:hypothetical protein